MRCREFSSEALRLAAWNDCLPQGLVKHLVHGCTNCSQEILYLSGPEQTSPTLLSSDSESSHLRQRLLEVADRHTASTRERDLHVRSLFRELCALSPEVRLSKANDRRFELEALSRRFSQSSFELRFAKVTECLSRARVALQIAKNCQKRNATPSSHAALALAYATLANACRLASSFAEQEANLEKAEQHLQLADPDPHTRLFVLSVRRDFLADNSETLGDAFKVQEKYRSLAFLLRDPERMAQARLDLIALLRKAGMITPEQMVELLREHLASSESAHSPSMLAVAQINVAVEMLNCREVDVTAVRAQLQACQDLCLEFEAFRHTWLSISATTFALEGRFDEANALFREALDLSSETGNPLRYLSSLRYISEALLLEGRWSESRWLVEYIRELAPRFAPQLRKGELLEIWLAAVAAERMDQATHDKLLSITVRDPSRL